MRIAANSHAIPSYMISGRMLDADTALRFKPESSPVECYISWGNFLASQHAAVYCAFICSIKGQNVQAFVTANVISLFPSNPARSMATHCHSTYVR